MQNQGRSRLDGRELPGRDALRDVTMEEGSRRSAG